MLYVCDVLYYRDVRHICLFVFNKNEEQANSITFEVHKKGSGIAGVYDYQIAEQKIADVAESANPALTLGVPAVVLKVPSPLT